jgi:AcrR family transcriptional regulator
MGEYLPMTEPSLREQRREHRRALGRDQILDAAERMFARVGYHEASLREIAELVEFSVGAVYGFFASKDDIYREIFLRRATEFLPRMQDVLSSERTPTFAAGASRRASCVRWARDVEYPERAGLP